MTDRDEVEALMTLANLAGPRQRECAVPSDTLAALCRAWLALDAGVPATAQSVGTDPDTGQPRIYAVTTKAALRDGPPLACRPVRIVPEQAA